MNAPAAFNTLPGMSPGVYSEADFIAVRDLVHREAGIVLPEGKAMLVYSRLAPLVRACGSGTFAAYVKLLDKDDAERHRAICALTTNHTAFYREGHHFMHFDGRVRERLVARALRGDPVRIWSSACSTGEEAWSIAVTLLGADRVEGRAIARSDVAILATDLADHALEAARAGRYASSALEAVPAPLRQLWFSESGGQAQIGPEAQALVRFRSLNLLGPWPMSRQFDVIFCRNVMIYFDQPTKERLLERFADQLAPGGFLYIGHSERVTGPAQRRFEPVGNTIYQRNGR